MSATAAPKMERTRKEPEPIHHIKQCIYCHMGWTMVYHVPPIGRQPYGFVTCSDCTGKGRADYEAYMDEHGFVDLRDARYFLPSCFGPMTDKPFPIYRSDGSVDGGWRLNEDKFIWKKGDGWMIPIMKRSGLGDIGRQLFGAGPQLEKELDLRAFRDPVTGMAITKKIMRKTLDVLDEGFYRWVQRRSAAAVAEAAVAAAAEVAVAVATAAGV